MSIENMKVFISKDAIDYCYDHNINISEILSDERFSYGWYDTLDFIPIYSNENKLNCCSDHYNNIKIEYYKSSNDDILITNITKDISINLYYTKDAIENLNKISSIQTTNMMDEKLEEVITNNEEICKLLYSNENNIIRQVYIKDLNMIAVLDIQDKHNITVLNFIKDI